MDHSNKIVYFKKPILCVHCNDYIWGVKVYGFQCNKCHRCFHSTCHHLYQPLCDHRPYFTPPPATSLSPIDLNTWTVENVADWMAVVNLYRYSELFKRYSIDGSELEKMSRERIKDIRIRDVFHIESIFIATDVLKNANNDDDVNVTRITPSNHLLSIYSFTSLQNCHVCNGYLLGIIQQGYQCRVCGLCCHRRCSVLQLPLCENGCVRKRDSFIEDSLFGKSLDTFLTIPPPILALCAENLELRASSKKISVLQFYRQTPETQKVLQLKDEIIKNSSNVYNVVLTQHAAETIGGIMKKFLRDLPEPIIPEKFYRDFINVVTNLSTDDQLKDLLHQLPVSHYQSLKFLLGHLTSDSTPDRIVREKLAHIFSMILLRPPWNQIMDIVHNSKIQSETINYLMTNRSLLFTHHQIPIHHVWYFADKTRDEVDDLMMNTPDGTYLVRNAANWDASEPYTLTLRKNGTNKLIKISRHNDQYGLSKNPPLFPSVNDLVQYYTHTSLATFHSSLDITLQYPLTKETYAIEDLEGLRQEFKDICRESCNLLVEMEALNCKHDSSSDLVRIYQNDMEAINKVIEMYTQHLDTSKSFIKDRSCSKEMKRYAEEGIRKMERKKKALVENLKRIEREVGVERKKLQRIGNHLEVMKDRGKELDAEKESKKRTLIELNESQSNIELLQSGKDVQEVEDIPHRDEQTWLVEGDRIRAIELLEGKPSGTFLIRPKWEDGNYALSIVSRANEVVHSIIDRKETGFGFADPYFIHPQLMDLVLHYKDTSLKEHNDSLDVTLALPVFA